MNRSADYRTLEDKLYDTFMAESATEGEKFNAGALYFKRTGKLIQMHVKTPDPNARPAYAGASVEDIMRQWKADEARRRARRETEEARWTAEDVRNATRGPRTYSAPRRRSTSSARRSRPAPSRSTRDYSARGWYRNAAGQWIDLDGRAHDSYGRYTKRRD